MVEEVIANKAIIPAIIPSIGKDFPTSKPITRTDPINPKNIPIHCFNKIFSFKKGPAKIFVSIGCKVTIKATIAVGNPTKIE